ncbi:MAG: sulfatase-like hydrolase/transferase [Planctomycetes bacterium]|nr:sulfatase-like hydrolase/transferase [Planctomycetota bacterium]
MSSNGLTRRGFLKSCSAVLGAGGVLLSNRGMKLRTGRKKPNLIVFMADDIGYESLSCYGSVSYGTPRLDELARGGVKFTNGHSQPLCTPSRTKIMTGRYNFRNYTNFGVFDLRERTFAHMLKAVDYDTCIVGKWQLMGGGAAGPNLAGFDEYHLWHMEDFIKPKGSRFADPLIIENGEVLDETTNQGKYGPDMHTDYAVDFIDRHKGEDANPFFIYYPMALVHNPFEPTPDSPEWGQSISDTRFYGDMVEYMDKMVGRIMDKVDEIGASEETLIIWAGDNGTNGGITSQMDDGSSIKGGKGKTTDAGTRVGYIASWKGMSQEGRVCEDIIDFADILPTLAEAAGAPLPKNVKIDGVSFLPQVRGEKGNPRGYIHIWYRRNLGQTLKRFVRDKRWKLYDVGSHGQANMLYDIDADVLEENPIGPSQGSAEAQEARARLQAIMDSIECDNC